VGEWRRGGGRDSETRARAWPSSGREHLPEEEEEGEAVVAAVGIAGAAARELNRVAEWRPLLPRSHGKIRSF
jgi:hypothetical protein